MKDRAMEFPITVPRLGWTMEQGTFVEWLKRDGEQVQLGDNLFVLEGEKATQDIEATDAGTLRISPDGPKPGDTVLVGAVVGHIISEVNAGASAMPAQPEVRAANHSVEHISVDAEESPAAVEKLSPPINGDLPPTQDSSEKAATKAASKSMRAISRRAKRIANEFGIDWSNIEGTGSTGRIREVDVMHAIRMREAVGRPGKPTPSGSTKRTPHQYSGAIDAHRLVVAERMLKSAQSTAAVTLMRTIDATHLVDLRKQFQVSASDQIVPTYNDILMKLTAIALAQHRNVNATWEDSHVVLCDEIHIAMAVDTDSGLLAPVLRSIECLTLRQIAGRTRELVERARNQKLSAADLQGGTFTITNLGMLGVDGFTPLINPPQAAILGVGRIVKEPAVVEDKIVVQHRMTLSLTFDHRILDGAPAAKFLGTLTDLLENPAPALIA